MFEIPVVLFIFKRTKAVKIVEAISKVQPSKLYIIADGARNDEETADVEQCRAMVEESINWPCKVIKNYAEHNRGVYENIGEGAKWVFSLEESAIFLEDDNLPEVTFFEYCKEMLFKYKNNAKVLWVCGTNYLEKYNAPHNESFLFTKHMLPCGWASWADKFLKYYDGHLETLDFEKVNSYKAQYYPRALFETMKYTWLGEYERISHGGKATSWDYQMDYSLKANDLYGICPMRNQIQNIGIDEFSIHGGTSKKKALTDRFCERKTYPLDFPLVAPKEVCIDSGFERRIGNIILPPIRLRIQYKVLRIIRSLFQIPYNITTKDFFKYGRKKRDNNN